MTLQPTYTCHDKVAFLEEENCYRDSLVCCTQGWIKAQANWAMDYRPATVLGAPRSITLVKLVPPDNNNNNEDNVYGAVINHHNSRVIARVHSVHAMNAEQHQMAAHLWIKPTDEPYARL